MAVEIQDVVNRLIISRGLADTHVISALTSSAPLIIGLALTELSAVFSEQQMIIITDELAYSANDKVIGKPGYSVDGASRFYYQLLLSGKEELAHGINQVLILEESK